MQVENFSSLESQVLSLLNEGNDTFEKLVETVQFSETTLKDTLENLISRDVLKLDTKTKKYKYSSPIDDKDMVILEGNILLPTTIIRVPEKGIMYVTRGEWYQFPIDFDVRKIIWNIKLVGKNNSTLVDLVKSAVNKEQRTTIKHNPDYDILKNKMVPYNDKINLLLHAIGDEIADVSIVFKIAINLEDNSDVSMCAIHKGFSVRTQIATAELINELHKKVNERDYEANINLNKIYNLSDFIFNKQEIPINYSNNVLKYARIEKSNKQKGTEIKYFKMDAYGNVKQIESEIYEPDELVEKVRELFNGYASVLLDNLSFLVETNA
jgi:hypothetical protein|nr:MAG TPA: winged helix-turn-helix domain protein [Caudoviricetes sp.]